MSTAVPTKVYTAADLLAMPDDGVERWIIRGQLREKPSEFPEVGMTVRNRHHCQIMIAVGATLKNWQRAQPQPRGQVYGGEAGVILPGGDGSLVGVDVVYVPPEVVGVQNDDDTTMLSGAPALAVEILSPNDTQEQTTEKVREYLAAGVPMVWIIDPDWRTVRVHRADRPTQAFNDTERMPAYPEMPGFAPTVAELFD